ncbi:hypothetical protein GGF32_009513 [Allomyces javanicus]|nr:hypothetical protein GGF32_009513 [Allomyces javanicus]
MVGPNLTKLRNLLRTSPISRYALISSAVQLVVQLGLESVVALHHMDAMDGIKSSPKLASWYNVGKAVGVYHYIYMIATVLQFYLTYNSVVSQNSIDLVALNIINLGLFGYSIMQYVQTQSLFANTSEDMKRIMPDAPPLSASLGMFLPAMAASFLFLVGTAWLSYHLHREYGWAIYKRIGADIGLRRQMMHYFFLMMLLKIGVFFYATFSLQFLVIGIQLTTGDTVGIAVHLAVSVVMIFVLVILCTRGTRTESSGLMYAFMIGTVGCIAYLAYKLYQCSTELRFAAVKRSMTFSIVLCLIVAVVTLVNSWLCFRSFGTGLIHYIGPNRHQTAANAAQRLESRFSLDGMTEPRTPNASHDPFLLQQIAPTSKPAPSPGTGGFAPLAAPPMGVPGAMPPSPGTGPGPARGY